MTDDDLHAMTEAERDAWTASLSADEQVILHTPIGYRYILVAIAEIKYWLTRETPAEFRLRLLQFLEGQADMFTPEAISIIEPMPPDGLEIVREARKLGKKWLDVVSQWSVFNAFVAMNPSMLAALKMLKPNGYQAGRL